MHLYSRALLPLLLILWLPLGASAATAADIIGVFSGLLRMLVPLIIALAIVYFLWGVAQYVMNPEADKKKAITTMVWGIVGIAVMVSVWGLVGILQSTFNVSSNGQPLQPHILKMQYY